MGRHTIERMRRMVEGSLKARGRFLRLLPPWRRPRLLTEAKTYTYPNGYQVEQLGTFPPKS